MDSPGGGGGLALCTPWSLANPDAVGADTPETVGRVGEWQPPPPTPHLPLPCAGAHSAGTRFPVDSIPAQQSPSLQHCILYSVICLRCNGVIRRTQKVIQGDDNGHVGRPCQVSPAPPCPELFCELRGLCRHSYFGPRTCSRSEKPRSSK